MGVAFLYGNGGGDPKKLPTLNASYPADVTINNGSTTSATFKVEIALDGKPAQYAYQWYVNGEAVDGATSETYTRTNLIKYEVLSVYCKVTNEAGTVQSRTATLSVKHTLLYMNGTRYDDVTGGFTAIGKKRESGADGDARAPLITYNSDHVLIYHNTNGQGIAHFTKKIDLTHYRTIYVKAQFFFKNGVNNWQLGTRVWSGFGTYANQNMLASWTPATGTHEKIQSIAIDVSNVTDSQYAGFWIQSSNNGHPYYYIKVYEVWLEAE